MADKLKIDDLKGLFRDRDIRLQADQGGPQDGVEKYNKYGIYCNAAQNKIEFLCMIMERDDPAANPDGPLTEDDYIPNSVGRLDLDSVDQLDLSSLDQLDLSSLDQLDLSPLKWKTEAGNMNLISSPSFSFLGSKREFIGELLKHLDNRRFDAAATSSINERFDESQP